MASTMAPAHSAPGSTSRGAIQQRTPAASSTAHAASATALLRIADERVEIHRGPEDLDGSLIVCLVRSTMHRLRHAASSLLGCRAPPSDHARSAFLRVRAEDRRRMAPDGSSRLPPRHSWCAGATRCLRGAWHSKAEEPAQPSRGCRTVVAPLSGQARRCRCSGNSEHCQSP